MMDTRKKQFLLTAALAVVLAISLLLSAVSIGLAIRLKNGQAAGTAAGDTGSFVNIVSGDRGIPNLSWAGKTWCSYGDSIVQEEKWQAYVTDYFGFAGHYNRGIGSSTFSKDGQTWYANPDGSYNSRRGFGGVEEKPEGTTEHEGYFCSSDRIDVSVPEDADLILIMGGTNDMGADVPIGDLGYPFDETTFKGAVASTVVKIQKKVPGAVVVLASPLSGRGPENGGGQDGAPEEGQERALNADAEDFVYNGLGLKTEDYRDAMEEVAKALSIPFIDVFGTTGINQWNRSGYMRDIVHPADTGGMAIARAVIGGLEQIKPNPVNGYTAAEGYRLADSASVREEESGNLSAELNGLAWDREIQEDRVVLTAELPGERHPAGEGSGAKSLAENGGLHTGVISVNASNQIYFEGFSLEISGDGQAWRELVPGLDYEIWGDTLWTDMPDTDIGWLRISHHKACTGGCTWQIGFYEPEGQKESFSAGSKVKGVKASVNNGEAGLMLDHDGSTRWTSGSAQEEGVWVTVQLKESCILNGMRLAVGDSVGDYPHDLLVEVSEDGENWVSCNAESSDQIEFAFSPVQGSYIRLTLGKIPEDVMANWSIHELTLYTLRDGGEVSLP